MKLHKNGIKSANAFVLQLIEGIPLGLLVKMLKDVLGYIGDVLR